MKREIKAIQNTTDTLAHEIFNSQEAEIVFTYGKNKELAYFNIVNFICMNCSIQIVIIIIIIIIIIKYESAVQGWESARTHYQSEFPNHTQPTLGRKSKRK